LVYGGLDDELCVIGYIDASFQTDQDNLRSQSGYVFLLNGGVVSWKCSKQSTIADSATEAEYIAASDVAKEAFWIREFINELGVVPIISNPIDLFCDNSSAIVQTKEPRSHQRTKHVLRQFHPIREINDRGDIKVCKVSGEDNPLTKPLAQAKHEGHVRAMRIRVINDCA
jgi:hypothetical protein